MLSSALSTSGAGTAAGPSYVDHPRWLRYQEFFPGALRLTERTAPQEEWWSWRGMTKTGRRTITYRTWIDCILDLIAWETDTDARPIVLFGVSTAGRLAYDVAALAGSSVRGIVVTCLADPRRGEVRRWLTARPELGQWANLLALVPMPLRPLRLPVRWLANIAAVANQAQFASLLWTDPLGGGWLDTAGLRLHAHEQHAGGRAGAIPRTATTAGPPRERPLVARNAFRPFFNRIGSVTRFTLLRGVGHLPVEEAGLGDLDRALREFLDELGFT